MLEGEVFPEVSNNADTIRYIYNKITQKKFLVRRSEVNRVTRASSHRHC